MNAPTEQPFWFGDIHLLRGMERGEGDSAGFPRISTVGGGGKEAVSRGKSVFVFTFFPS